MCRHDAVDPAAGKKSKANREGDFFGLFAGGVLTRLPTSGQFVGTYRDPTRRQTRGFGAWVQKHRESASSKDSAWHD